MWNNILKMFKTMTRDKIIRYDDIHIHMLPIICINPVEDGVLSANLSLTVFPLILGELYKLQL